jgi:hypothetical protein
LGHTQQSVCRFVVIGISKVADFSPGSEGSEIGSGEVEEVEGKKQVRGLSRHKKTCLSKAEAEARCRDWKAERKG